MLDFELKIIALHRYFLFFFENPAFTLFIKRMSLQSNQPSGIIK